MSASLLDTSFVVAAVEPAELPSTAAVSVITLGELYAGVLRARDERTRVLRRRRLTYIRTAFEALVVDQAVAERYGELLALARSQRRTEKATDLLIAATAGSSGRTLYTLDERQAGLARAAGIAVVSP